MDAGTEARAVSVVIIGRRKHQYSLPTERAERDPEQLSDHERATGPRPSADARLLGVIAGGAVGPTAAAPSRSVTAVSTVPNTIVAASPGGSPAFRS